MATASAPGGDARYFQTTKKGEIRELTDDLNGTNRENIKEAVKKVIAAMTVGKDVSMLFSDVIKSMGTPDIELKKLVYLYIINYARSQPEKAILVVNMFQRDAREHPNPLVRALAIRTMGCIRVEEITDHLCDPLNNCLQDSDPYVRKTAAICVAKMYDINRQLVEERAFVDKLRSLLSDNNPMVQANAVAALHEISESSGEDHFHIDGATLSKLLTALNECTEWGVVFILDALAKFQANDTQAHDIIERVSPQLSNANPAVVLSAVKVVLQFLDQCEESEQTRFTRKLTPPMVTLLSAHAEIQYVALRNINLIVQKYPRILSSEVRVFFVKYNDSVYIKLEKLEVLVKLATVKNIDQILLELKEYAQEIDVEFVRKAVRAIGRVAIKLDKAAEKCVRVLTDLVRTGVNYVVQEAVIVIKDIFRRYPRKYERIIVELCDNLDSLDEPEAKASMIWIIGEYAQRIADAGERLEYFLETFEDEGPMVQLQLLTATVKLFLRKPDETKDLVQHVLNLATENTDNPDLRDRGYIYWRLLSTDPAAAKSVVLAERPEISADTFAIAPAFLNEMLNHLSTLAAVYHKLPQDFVRGVNNVTFDNYAEPEESDESESGSEDDDDDDDDDESDSEDDEKRPARPQARPVQQQPRQPERKEPEVNDLLDLGMLGGGAPAASTTTTPGGPAPGGDMFFDPFGGSAPAAPTGPPMHVVSPAAQSHGVEVSASYARVGGVPTMNLRFANQGGAAPVARAALKLNKNYLGIQPAGPVSMVGQAAPGGSCTGTMPMALPQPNFINPAGLDLSVQMALKTDLGVSYFKDVVPAHIFFAEDGRLEQNAFLQLWQSAGISEHSVQLRSVSVGDHNGVAAKLEENNAFKVAERGVPGRGMIVYHAAKLKNVFAMIEVSIANTGACRVVVKSQEMVTAQICALAVQTLIA